MRCLIFFAIISTVLGVASCSDNVVIEEGINRSFPLFIENNTWQISYFSEGSIDETSTYYAYILEFEEDGVLKVLNKESVYIGTWKISKYFSHHLDFDFSSYEGTYDKDFEFLNHSWEVYFQQNGIIKLQRTDNRSILLHLKVR